MTRRPWHVALVGAIALSAPAAGQSGDDTKTLAARIAELEARDTHNQAVIAELQGELRGLDDDGWLDEARAAEVRALVGDVLADADTRASLQDRDVLAGYDNGFFLGSDDGNFKLRFGGQIQFRYVLSLQSNSGDAATGNDDTRGGFELTRVRLAFKGHVLDPSWQYFLWGGYGADGGAILLDAWVRKSFDNGWAAQAGQFKTEAWREWTVSETSMQFVARSLIDARYGVSYTQGVAVEYKTGDLRVNMQLHDGIRTRATPWNAQPEPANGIYQQANEFAFGVRGEYMMWGDGWADYLDWEGWRDGEGLGVVGGSVYVQNGEYGTTDESTEILQWSVDGTFKWSGWNLFAAIIGTSIDQGSAVARRDELAALVQAGCFVTEDIELMARYEWGDLDGGGVLTDELSVLTLGVSKFWHRHALEWTTDVGVAFDRIDAAWMGRDRGYRVDGPGEDGQVVVRSQFNLLF